MIFLLAYAVVLTLVIFRDVWRLHKLEKQLDWIEALYAEDFDADGR